mgnify:CR=1 FL=1
MSDFEQEVVLLERTVVCHTAGCPNAEIAVTFPCLEHVICGACGQQIVDVGGEITDVTTP